VTDPYSREPEPADDPLGVRQSESEMLKGFLDWHRQVIVNKVDGLTLEQASTVLTSTGLSPLGIVKHLACVEIAWFRDVFACELVDDVSHEDTFRLAPGDTVASVVEQYRDACDHSRRIVDATQSLDATSARAHEILGHVSLRWTLVHMLEETARHAGHLDLMRESVDGRTGD
jgi:hypothetical protein